MRDAITVYLPYVLSLITIYGIVKAGDRKRWAWLVGLGNQALWLTWITSSESWGLLPLTFVLCVVYTRNWFKWKETA